MNTYHIHLLQEPTKRPWMVQRTRPGPFTNNCTTFETRDEARAWIKAASQNDRLRAAFQPR
jgi:hypothetical protein